MLRNTPFCDVWLTHLVYNCSDMQCLNSVLLGVLIALVTHLMLLEIKEFNAAF